MRGQPGFFDIDEPLERGSELGNQLDAFAGAVDFAIFRADLVKALAYSDGSQGRHPPFDPVMMFKVLVIQAANSLSDERTEFLISEGEFLISEGLSFMRFLGLGLSDRVCSGLSGGLHVTLETIATMSDDPLISLPAAS